MKQTKKILCLVVCGFLLFSTLAFGIGITGKWTSSFPKIERRYGKNIFVYSFPAIELEFFYPSVFHETGVLFIHDKSADFGERVCIYKFRFEFSRYENGCELNELNLYGDSNGFCIDHGIVTFEKRDILPDQEMHIQGLKGVILPNGTYYFVGRWYYL